MIFCRSVLDFKLTTWHFNMFFGVCSYVESHIGMTLLYPTPRFSPLLQPVGLWRSATHRSLQPVGCNKGYNRSGGILISQNKRARNLF